MTLARFTKQPADIQDYDIDFSEWLAGFADTGISHTVVAEPGITRVTSSLFAGVVKVWLSGGSDGMGYKVTATVTTLGGRVKQAEITIRVKET